MRLSLRKKAAPAATLARQSLRGLFAILASARASARSRLSRFGRGSAVAAEALEIPESAVAGAPIDRLRVWVWARLLNSANRNEFGMWPGRAEMLFEAAVSAWVRDQPSRPVTGLFSWMGSVESLASWVAERETEEGDETLLGVKRYLGFVPGYTQGQPATGNSITMHSYVMMQLFGPLGVARYVERCCDDPDALRALARAGFEPLRAPSEDRAFEGLCWLERQEIEQETAAAPARREWSRRI